MLSISHIANKNIVEFDSILLFQGKRKKPLGLPKHPIDNCAGNIVANQVEKANLRQGLGKDGR